MKKILLILMCLIIAVSAGCSIGKKAGGETVRLYFPDSDKKTMVTEDRVIPEGEKNTIEFAVKALIKGPETEGFKKAFPEGTRILNIKLDGGIATVDLSGEFNTGTKIDRLWSRYTLINTVCGIKGVKKTQILVNGEVITSISSGEPLGPMGSEDIVTDIGSVTKDTMVATLYFADENAISLVPEAREIVLEEGEKVEKAVIEALLKGPKRSGLYSVLPQGIKVLSAETKDGVCFLNLSAEFSAEGMGSSLEILAVYSVVNTLCDVEGIDRVQILIEGKKSDEFGHLSLEEALESNNQVLKINAE